MYPVDASSLPSSRPGAPSPALTTLSSYSPVGRRSATVLPPDAAVASDMQVPLTVTRVGGACRSHRQPFVRARPVYFGSRRTPPRWGMNSPLTLVERLGIAQPLCYPEQ